jgi:hypothetical protein
MVKSKLIIAQDHRCRLTLAFEEKLR